MEIKEFHVIYFMMWEIVFNLYPFLLNFIISLCSGVDSLKVCWLKLEGTLGIFNNNKLEVIRITFWRVFFIVCLLVSVLSNLLLGCPLGFTIVSAWTLYCVLLSKFGTDEGKVMKSVLLFWTRTLLCFSVKTSRYSLVKILQTSDNWEGLRYKDVNLTIMNKDPTTVFSCQNS